MLPSLWSDTECEYKAGLHQLVQSKFMDIVHQFFKPIASMPDYFFFSPEAQQRASMVSDGVSVGSTESFIHTAHEKLEISLLFVGCLIIMILFL